MKNEVYSIITERILDLLKAGTVPWHKPWRTTCYGGQCGAAFNLKSKKPYRGMNVFILAASGFASPWWVTLKQANELGGKVRKGERSTQVIFWKFIDAEKIVDGVRVASRIPLLRYYNVFNVEQCEGLESKIPQADKPAVEPTEFQAIEAAEEVVENMPFAPLVTHGGNRACYSPSLDVVNMPPREAFDGSEHYYSVLFHELGHSTGHESRLNRKGVSGSNGEWSPMGSPTYAKEELVAEMTAAFLCGECGIEGTYDSSASYIAHWRKHLSDDPTMVVHAASAAQKAADFILGRQNGAKEEAVAEMKKTLADVSC